MRGKHPVSDAQIGRLARIQWELMRRVKEGTLPADEVIRSVREIALQRKVDPDLYLARKALAQGLAEEDDRENACSAYTDLVRAIAESGDLAAARTTVAEIVDDGEYTHYWRAFAFAEIAGLSKATEDFAEAESCLRRFKDEDGDDELGVSIKREILTAYAKAGNFDTARAWARQIEDEEGGHCLGAPSCKLDTAEAWAAIYAQSRERSDCAEGKRIAGAACDSHRGMAYGKLACALFEHLEIEKAIELLVAHDPHPGQEVCAAAAEAFARTSQWDSALEWATDKHYSDADAAFLRIAKYLAREYRSSEARSFANRIKMMYMRALAIVAIADASLQWGDLEDAYQIAEELQIPWQQAEVYTAIFSVRRKMEKKTPHKH